MEKKHDLFETHVRLTKPEKRGVEAIAKREDRSVTAQIAVLVRQGLKADAEHGRQ